MYVSILFVLVGLIGYTSFVNKINEINTETKNKIREQEEKHAVHNDEFTKLKAKDFEVMTNLLEISSRDSSANIRLFV